ncbi:lipid A biosynthesis lauroyl acyltransferase [Campylobacter sp. CCS1377]|uniref:Lipid A biosynthesis lauroyl acyltransferase n=1 Tax=Campylobacter sp. CCS1377 TaxID=3158229 RepID=A0AAU7E7T9_9BACT
MDKNYLYLSLYCILKFCVNFFPDFILNFIAKTIARITFWCNKKHRKIIDTNLQFCFPEKNKKQRDEIALKIYQNFTDFGIDFIKNQNISKEEVLKKVIFENEDFLKQSLESKKPIILITAHYGNWELSSLAYAAKFGAISIVGRALDSKIMDKILSKNRTQFNIELINKFGGLKKMFSCLKNKRTLGILTDQDATDNESMVLNFFGHKVNFIVGASVLAKKTNALIIPSFIYKNENKGYNIKCFKPMDANNHSIEELTLYQAKCCEEMIKFKPDEYFFFHKRFKRFHSQAYD